MNVLRSRLAIVVGFPVLVAIITAVVCWGFMPNKYTSEVSIYALAKDTEDATNEGVSYNDLSASQLLANDFAELAKNEQVRADTAAAIGMDDLDGFEIAITSSSTTRIIKVSVTGADPQSAALVVNELTDQIGKAAMRVMNVQAVNVINTGKAPTEPSGPHRFRYLILSLPISFLFAVAIVILREMVDTRVHSGSEIEEMLGVSVIGHVPVSKGR